MRKIHVYVSSESAIQLEANGQAFGNFFAEAKFHIEGRQCSSDMNELPFGLIETMEAANNRLQKLISMITEPAENSYFVAIQEGANEKGEGIGIVLLMGPDQEVHMEQMEKIQYPDEDFQEARRLGFDKYMVGTVMAKRLNDPGVGFDPHFYLTGKHRKQYLEDPITKILNDYYKEME